MEEKIINVNLYGGKSIFGGRETPLRAEIISCDKCDKCSYYQNNQCLNVTAPFSKGCKFGKINRIRGYTSRAQKYYTFKTKYEKHEQYNKLKYPSNKLGLIDNMVVFLYPYITINETENGNISLDDPGFGTNIAYIQYEKFTPELINRICKFQPCAIMGGVITSYQNKTVPLFLAHLKEVLPNRYLEVKQSYPELIKEINYVGRKALLQTINPSQVHYESRNYPQFNETWDWDGEFLIYDSGYVSRFNITNQYEIINIKIKPTDKSEIIISDNKQVSDKTVFVD